METGALINPSGTAASVQPSDPPPPAGAFRDRWSPPVVALVVWLVTVPMAFVVPRAIDGNPFTNQAMAVVLATAFVAVGVVLALAWRWRRDSYAGVAAGLAATWTAFTLQMALQGTPFGYGGMQGDMVRMSATVTRYGETFLPSDPWVKGVAAEYPMLYPWLVGRASDILHIPAWQLLGEAETLTISAAVLVAFACWHRWAPGWAAFAVAITAVSVFGDPRKAFEVLALAVFVPWVFGTFATPPRGRLHWSVSGAVAGVLYLLYPGWMIYGAPGLLVLAWLTWRTEPRRRQYLAYLAKVVAVAVLVASPQLLTYLWAMATDGTETVSDLYNSPTLNSGVFPLLSFTPLGVLQLVGFFGCLWLFRSAWWARPILILAVGAFAYRVLMMLRFAATDHTMFFHYSARLYAVVLAIGGVLVLSHAVSRLPGLLARADVDRGVLRRVGVAALALSVAWLGYAFANEWMPGPRATYAADAHQEPLQGGGYPRFAPQSERIDPFPVREVERFVENVRDTSERPVVLSCDERLFGYLPWYGYLGVSRTSSSSLVLWDSREAELRRVVSAPDPRAFARATAETEFGAIDVFVLEREENVLRWRDIEMRREQFGPAYWATADLSSDTFVAVRR